MGFTLLTSYDTASCAAQCDAIAGCQGINIAFERSPLVDPGTGCTNPPSTTLIKVSFPPFLPFSRPHQQSLTFRLVYLLGKSQRLSYRRQLRTMARKRLPRRYRWLQRILEDRFLARPKLHLRLLPRRRPRKRHCQRTYL